MPCGALIRVSDDASLFQNTLLLLNHGTSLLSIAAQGHKYTQSTQKGASEAKHKAVSQ